MIQERAKEKDALQERLAQAEARQLSAQQQLADERKAAAAKLNAQESKYGELLGELQDRDERLKSAVAARRHWEAASTKLVADIKAREVAGSVFPVVTSATDTCLPNFSCLCTLFEVQQLTVTPCAGPHAGAVEGGSGSGREGHGRRCGTRAAGGCKTAAE